MTRSLRLRAAIAFGGAVLLIGWLSGPGWARQPIEYPRPYPNVCVPNVRGFGYFETKWRRWPGELRPEQINPRGAVSEEIPKPEGREEIPPPRTAMPLPPSSPVPSEEELPLPEGTIVPPEGLLLPGEIPIEPSPGGPSKPLFENGLPGLPGLPAAEPKPTEPKSAEPKPSEPKPAPKAAEKPAAEPAPKTAEKPTAEPAPKAAEKPAAEPAPKAPQGLPDDQGLRSRPSYDVPRPATATAPPTAGAERHGGVVSFAGRLEPERNLVVPRPKPRIVSFAGRLEPERNVTLPGAYHADSIASIEPSRWARRVEPAAYATVESPGWAEADDDGGVPPVALNGYCPVELTLNGRWAQGDLRWTVVHKGLIYRLSGDRQRREFLADPDRFAPVDSGNDRVILIDQRQTTPGRAEFCAIYRERLYMFSSAANQARFNQHPNRYAVEE